MRRVAAIPILAVALAALAAGCGSGGSSSASSTTSSSTTTLGGGSSSTGPTSTGTTPTTTSGEGVQGSSTESSNSSQTPENSIKTYGSAAASAQKTELKDAAFSFFRAMAASDYPKLCEALSASDRKAMEAFTKAKHPQGGCPAILKSLISTRGVPEARKAAQGRLSAVRVKGGTAFVLFRPRGGPPSYFVLKREGRAWKATGLAPGAPINPLAH
jgi:hypothetical protein